MQGLARWSTTALAVAAVFVAGCGGSAREPGPRVVQPGLPGEPGREVRSIEAAAARLPHTEADVRFMQGMIVHHMQALVMSRLAPDRTTTQEILLLARRIEVSQYDEIALMARWLEVRGEPGPDAHAHHAHHEHPATHGMLSPQQIEQLAAARTQEFDRLFLELMIQHHEGALQMVAELYASPGGAQEEEISVFVQHVEGDQSAEIARMRRMLERRR